MQPEHNRLFDDETYELDRKAWNLPRPRPELTIASLSEASYDEGSDEESRANGDTEPNA